MMDVLQRIRSDLGSGVPLSVLFDVASEAGVSKWTLLKVARGPNPNPHYRTLAKMAEYYAKVDAQ